MGCFWSVLAQKQQASDRLQSIHAKAAHKMATAGGGSSSEGREAKRRPIRRLAKPKTKAQLEIEAEQRLATTVWDMTDRMGSEVVEVAIGVSAVIVVFGAMIMVAYVS